MKTIRSVKHPLSMLALAAMALAAGCDRSAPDGSEGWPAVDNAASMGGPQTHRLLPRACTLLTLGDAQAAIGPSAGQMADDPENCMWSSSDHPGTITMLMVQVIRGGTLAETDSLYETLTGLTGNLNMAVNKQLGAKTRKSGQQIEGLGDAAWCSSSNADLVGAQQLIIRDGTVIVSLNITGMTKGGRQASLCPRLETAGRVALGRLGGAS